MAIILPYTNGAGVTASQAYHRVIKVVYRHSGESIVEVEVYFNKSNATAGSDPVDIYQTSFTMDVSNKGTNVKTQAYAAVKSKTQVMDSKGRVVAIDFSKAQDD
jgi:hypothetical protein